MATQEKALAAEEVLPMMSYHVGHRIRLDDCASSFVDRISDKAKSELCLRLGEGWVFLFSFGSIVFISVEKSQIEVFLKDLLPFVDGRNERISDDFRIVIDREAKEKVHFDHISVNQAGPQRLKLTALVLAQSTTLEHFEKLVEAQLDRAAAFTDAMASGVQLGGSLKQMVSFIGVGLATRREIVSNLAILDSPDVVWEDSALDSLFQGLKANFELSGRYRTLEHKLRLIHESVEVLVDLSHTRRSLFLEIIIIVLIAVEVGLAIWGTRPHP